MSEKIKKHWEAVKTRLKKVSKKAYIIIGIIVVILAAALTIASTKNEIAVSLLVQLRNKALDAYSELTRISL